MSSRRHDARPSKAQKAPIHALLHPAPESSVSDRFFAEFNATFSRLRKDKRAWKKELEERRAWDATLTDGQGEELWRRPKP